MRQSACVIGLSVVLSAGAGAPAMAGETATISRIVELTNTNNTPSGINDNGDVVGSYRPSGGPFRGFSYTAAGVFTQLEPIQDASPTNLASEEVTVTAVLPNGDALGFSDTRWGITDNAVQWADPNSPTAVFGGIESDFGGVSEGIESLIFGSNFVGDFCGSRNVLGVTTPFIWVAGSEDPAFLDLPFGSTSAIAIDVGDNLDAVLQTTTAGTSIGTRGVYVPGNGGAAVDIGDLGSPGVRPLAINGSGEVVGFANITSSRTIGFGWDPANGMRQVPVLGVPDRAPVNDINNLGDAVGYTDTGSNEFAWVWNVRTNELTFLITLLEGADRDEWEIRRAFAINDKGQVVGTGRFQGQNATFIMQLPGYNTGGCNDADVAEPFGQLDFFDAQIFLASFANGDPEADLTSDGTLDFFDVQAFLDSFSAGCP